MIGERQLEVYHLMYHADDALQEDILHKICEEIKEFIESVNDDGQACASSIFSMIMAKLTTEVKKLITVDMMKLSIEFEPKSTNQAKRGDLLLYCSVTGIL